MDIEQYRFRSKIFRAIRDFFDNAGYIETDTPILSTDLIPETCLEVFKTERILPCAAGSPAQKRELYLMPSPEIHIKKIIAQWKKSVYQIARCFRNGESEGRIHNIEFTMLEYYTIDADFHDSIGITQALFSHILRSEPELCADCNISAPFLQMTINEAFIKYAGFDLFNAVNNQTLDKEAQKRGIIVNKNTGTQVLYDLLFVAEIEPKLPKDKAVFLLDYPAFVPALAALNKDGKTRQRWELYLGGVELANCYSEERDAQRVREFFENEAAEKEKNALVKHAVDKDYWKIFEKTENYEGFPKCSGVAMGLDRLLMALSGKKTIPSYE